MERKDGQQLSGLSYGKSLIDWKGRVDRRPMSQVFLALAAKAEAAGRREEADRMFASAVAEEALEKMTV